MQEQYVKYYSHHLDRDVEMLVYGHWGYPILLFPTTLGRHYQAKDMGLIESVRGLIEAGTFKIYCVDSIDADSWYAKHLPPPLRVLNHMQYDKFLTNELVPKIQQECAVAKIGVAGCSFGGYHAFNFAFRHPEQVAYLLSLSGAFDMRSFLEGHYDDNVYFNNPVDYVPNEQGWRYGHMKIVLGTAEWDICYDANLRMSGILSGKGIDHWLDVRGWQKHDWPLWHQMFPDYLARVF
ncbi:alpha/beta hydrolase-fold protein [Rhabdobacter roseus]|uniref:Esterase/lipase superfamily enzyme n=1 Tax=Rhabdobacter roseus TaxID=1655419 RepID=A0A840TJX6_9BACT|nr:alpha/beta hydrolase-fold protein [Rhabdobacter roseus]MBB5283235.1 esterase/lipase superfamily enzyme [Rhabdobacter roseus]